MRRSQKSYRKSGQIGFLGTNRSALVKSISYKNKGFLLPNGFFGEGRWKRFDRWLREATNGGRGYPFLFRRVKGNSRTGYKKLDFVIRGTIETR